MTERKLILFLGSGQKQEGKVNKHLMSREIIGFP